MVQTCEAANAAGLWMAPIDRQAACEKDEFGRPRYWGKVGAVLAPAADGDADQKPLTWVQVRGNEVVVIKPGRAANGLSRIVAQEGGVMVKLQSW